MAEYTSKELHSASSEVVANDEQALIEELAAKERALLTSDDVRKGGSIHSTAAFCGNLVIFGSADKHVYALDKNTGKLVWKFLTGDSVASSPCVDNGIVYIGSYDGHIYALRAADGSKLWKYYTGDVVFASPRVSSGIVYVGSFNGYEYALRAETGELVWKFRTGSMIETDVAIVNDTVIVASDDFWIYALDAETGILRWKYKITGTPTQMSLATASGTFLSNSSRRMPVKTHEPVVVCFGTWVTGDILTLDARTGSLVTHNRAVCGNPDQPTMYDGIIYFGSLEQNFYALDPKNERIIWKFYTGGMVPSGACIRDGVVYFGSCDQHVYALSRADGKPLWKFRTDGVVTSTPVVDGDVLYFGSWDAYFYVVDARKRELVWKFRTASPPSKPSFIKDLSAVQLIKRAIVRWWKPEAPRITVYEANISQSRNIGASPYRLSEPYKSEVRYQTGSPYEMKKEKRDWRDAPRK